MVTQSRAPTILLTRPTEQAARFAAQLRASLGEVTVLQSPLLAPEFLPLPPGLPPCTALILTSVTGAEAARRISASGAALPRRAFCVGDSTARAAGTAGFEALSAGGNADDLLRLIQLHHPTPPLLYLRGEDVAADMADSLTKGGLVTHSAIIYRQNPQPLTAPALTALAERDPIIVPVFSPRSARLLQAALPKGRTAPLWVAAISTKAAEAAAGMHPERMVIADHPDAPAMLRAVAALLAAGRVP